MQFMFAMMKWQSSAAYVVLQILSCSLWSSCSLIRMLLRNVALLFGFDAFALLVKCLQLHCVHFILACS